MGSAENEKLQGPSQRAPPQYREICFQAPKQVRIVNFGEKPSPVSSRTRGKRPVLKYVSAFATRPALRLNRVNQTPRPWSVSRT